MLSKLFLLLSVIFVPAALSAQTPSKITENTAQPNIDYKQVGAPMPRLIFLAYNDTSVAGMAAAEEKKKKEKRKKKGITDTGRAEQFYMVTEKDLDNDANLLIMLFNPTCSHCEEMTDLMSKNIAAFKKTKIVLLANKLMMPYMPDFAERHKISSYAPMYVGYDSTGFIENMFLYQALPQINIYDRDRKLLKIFSGEVPMDTLKKFIQ